MTVLGIVAALPAEAIAFSGRRQAPGTVLELPGDVLLHGGGVGSKRAQAAASHLIERGARALVSWGLAGGLDPECRAGDLLLPRAIHRADHSEVPCDEQWCFRLEAQMPAHVRVRVGGHVESAGVLADLAAKRAQHARGMMGVDMESGAVAAVGSAAGLPVIAVRAVSDTADVAIPATAVASLGSDGRTLPGAALAGLARRPRDVVGLWRLWRGSTAALRTLRAVAQVTAQRLAFEERR